MRRLAAVLLLIGALLAAPTVAAQKGTRAGFVAGTEDVPLMPGLRNEDGTLVVFDKPQGRIIEVEARGKVTRAAVEKFYATSLPALGWVAEGTHGWSREGEGLRLDIKGRDGDVRVGFSLSPR
jgi:hypothetical protein